MAAAVHHRVPVRHADVPQAFLQAQNNRPIYIDLPKGIGVKSHILEAFREQHPRGKACFRLIKSLYGLASAPMIFSKALSQFLIGLGMSRARVDSTLFSWQDPVSKKWTVVTTFVDDLLITGTDEAFETNLRERLIERFGEGLTWADNVKSFLGLRITRNDDLSELKIDAQFKIEQLLTELDLDSFGPFRGSIAPYGLEFNDIRLSQGKVLSNRQTHILKHFSHIVGVLIYISICCRPDITTVLNRCCQGTTNPQRHHVVWLERLLMYLRSHSDIGLVYRSHQSDLETLITKPLSQHYTELKGLHEQPIVCFSDANFADAADDKLRSTSGFCIYLFGCLIAWSSKRQSITARSTLEAELIAAASASDECVWIFHFAQTAPFLFGYTSANQVRPVPLLVDNEPALSTANHPKITAQTKHIRLREFRIRDAIGDDHAPPRIRCLWCPTKFNVADHFTKLLPQREFSRLARFVVNIPPAEIHLATKMPKQPGEFPKHGTSPQQYYLDVVGHNRPLNLALALIDENIFSFYDISTPLSDSTSPTS